MSVQNLVIYIDIQIRISIITRMLRNKKNELYLKVGNKRRMFCRICAQTIMGEVKLLRLHHQTQHGGIGEPEFLQEGQDPVNCIWSNWPLYRADPLNVKLEMFRERRRALHTQRGWFEPKADLTSWLG